MQTLLRSRSCAPRAWAGLRYAGQTGLSKGTAQRAAYRVSDVACADD
jgi:hypothetical protein